ncbi:MAG: patatin-like phospholipase family protein, partial [Alphaproteobacteria bacterium]|nr:patatin-like phospholipase family protein [Alphaproteobacteria bacterium]
MQKKKVALALQGGGAHGAFAWGVADRLLEDGRFDIEGVSGTSAGGMNAAAIVQGLIKGGAE